MTQIAEFTREVAMNNSTLVVDGQIAGDLAVARRESNGKGIIDGKHHSEYLGEVQRLVEARRKDEAVALLIRVAAAADMESRCNSGLVLDPTGYTALLFLLWDMNRERDAATVMATFSQKNMAA